MHQFSFWIKQADYGHFPLRQYKYHIEVKIKWDVYINRGQWSRDNALAHIVFYWATLGSHIHYGHLYFIQ